SFEEAEQQVMLGLKAYFKPEFLNRIDETIVFHALDKEHMKQILNIQLDRLSKRLKERNISISLTEKAKNYVVETGFDPAYGARPLKRAIQKEIETPLSKELVKSHFIEGDNIKVDVDTSTDKLYFSKMIEILKK
ncbi:MAG: hypothetical protein AB7V50_07750, partial [Vampirovibrionia bacterium]